MQYSTVEYSEQGHNHDWKVKGDQGLGPSTGALALHTWPKAGRAGCWVREGVAPFCCEGPGVSCPGKFLKTQMLNPAFWWLLCLYWRHQYIVGPPPKKLGTSLPRSLWLLRLW